MLCSCSLEAVSKPFTLNDARFSQKLASPQASDLPGCLTWDSFAGMENDPPPPPKSAPPVIIPPALPIGRSGRGRGWMVLALVLGFLLALVLFTEFTRGARWSFGSKPGGQSGRWLEEVTVESN